MTEQHNDGNSWQSSRFYFLEKYDNKMEKAQRRTDRKDWNYL